VPPPSASPPRSSRRDTPLFAPDGPGIALRSDFERALVTSASSFRIRAEFAYHRHGDPKAANPWDRPAMRDSLTTSLAASPPPIPLRRSVTSSSGSFKVRSESRRGSYSAAALREVSLRKALDHYGGDLIASSGFGVDHQFQVPRCGEPVASIWASRARASGHVFAQHPAYALSTEPSLCFQLRRRSPHLSGVRRTTMSSLSSRPLRLAVAARFVRSAVQRLRDCPTARVAVFRDGTNHAPSAENFTADQVATGRYRRADPRCVFDPTWCGPVGTRGAT